MPEMIRKKIKWATKRRKCGMRVWKTKWITVPAKTGSPTGAPPKSEKPRGERPEKAEKPKAEKPHVEKPHVEKVEKTA